MTTQDETQQMGDDPALCWLCNQIARQSGLCERHNELALRGTLRQAISHQFSEGSNSTLHHSLYGAACKAGKRSPRWKGNRNA